MNELWKSCVLVASLTLVSFCPSELSASSSGVTSAQDDQPIDVSFSGDIAPLLARHCLECHNADLPEGGFRVDSYAQLMTPGDSGVAIDRKVPGESELLYRVRTDDESLRMPLDGEALSESQIGLLATWIKQGASFDGSDPSLPLSLLLPPPTYEPPPREYVFPVAITSLEFSANGTMLYVGGYHEVLKWDWQAEELVQRISNLPERITSIEVHPTDDHLYVAGGQPGERGEVRVVHLDTGDLEGVPFVSRDVVWDASLAPDGRRIAVAAADRQLAILDLADSTIVRRFPVHSDWVVDVAWDPPGQRIASASRDLSAKVFDVEQGLLVANYPDHEAEVRGVRFLSRAAVGERSLIDELVSVGANGVVDRWRASDAHREKRQRLSRAALFPAIVLPDRLILADARGQVWSVDWELSEFTKQFDALDRDVTSIACWVNDSAGSPSTTEQVSAEEGTAEQGTDEQGTEGQSTERQSADGPSARAANTHVDVILAMGLSDGTVVIRSLEPQAELARFVALPLKAHGASAESQE